MKKTIRTPEARFENLPGYSFTSHYLEVEEGLRLHYLDEGDKNGPVVLLLHGEPSWSYLYRKMIPVFVTHNFRVIAPDLIGFGKSDKLLERGDYSYRKHIDWISTLITKLDLQEILLFCQDWGGLIGLRIVTEMEDRFAMIVASNTALASAGGFVNETFLKWREYSQRSPDFDIGKVIDMGTRQTLSETVKSAYNAPFPSEEYKAGARIFPMLVPIDPSDPESDKNKEAFKKLKQWTKPFLTVFGTQDAIMKGQDKIFQNAIPGARNQKHSLLDAGHFIQEEKGQELAQIVVQFYKDNNP